MRFARALVIAVAAGFALAAPPAEASELVKLAKLIVTGKRTPTVPATEPAKPATQTPASSTPRADAPTPASPDRIPAIGMDGMDLQEAPRMEAPQRHERGGERIGGAGRGASSAG